MGNEIALPPCKICGRAPTFITLGIGGKHSHRSIMCNDCGIEITHFTFMQSRRIWQKLMTDGEDKMKLLSDEVREMADADPQDKPRLSDIELNDWADRIAELEEKVKDNDH